MTPTPPRTTRTRRQDAADEAAKYAGQAIDYANKSTAHAAAAVDAANVATKTVNDAVAVAQAARDAELASLDEDKQQGLDEAAELVQTEADDRAEYENKRTQADQTEQAIKDLISQAEQALASNDLAVAATLGRKASIGLLDAKGAWTREAAQFALSGSDADVHAWIDTDRAIAQGEDDRETALYLAEVSVPAIGEAAQTALESDGPATVRNFLTEGVIEAAADDYRVQIARILNDNPGKAVKAAANAALDTNTAKVLQDFFDTTFPNAIREDDAVTCATLLNNGGPYTKAYAEVALAGPTWMRRHFVQLVQHKTAQLDYDSATHVAAIQGAIAAAAKIAYEAQQDAALASADQSATDAQESANTAKAAAETARSAARSANYSANKAIDAARSALNSSYSAQESAVSARQSAIAAGKDAAAAADAASEARSIATQKRKAEAAEKARQATEEAKENQESGTNPADDPTNDQVNPNGTSGGEDEWWNDAGWYADVFNTVSKTTGYGSTGCLVIALYPPASEAALLAAAQLGQYSMVSSTLGTLFTGIEYGFTSSKFGHSVAKTALNLIFFGQGTAIGKLAGGGGVIKTATQLGMGVGSQIIGALTPW